MIPASGILAFLLLGIEEIGVQIEEPFSILPLGEFCSYACTQLFGILAMLNALLNAIDRVLVGALLLVAACNRP